MAAITIVGLGPGPVDRLTREAESELLAAEKIFFRTSGHPVYEWLRERNKHLVCFDRLYTTQWSRPGEIYEFMVSALLKEAQLQGKVTYALPGSPVFLEDTTRLLQERGKSAGIEIRLIHGLSFLEDAFEQSQVNFAEGLQIVLPLTHLEAGCFTTKLPMLVCQIEAKSMPTDEPQVARTVEFLLRAYPAEHPVTLIWTDGRPEYKTQTRIVKLEDLAHECEPAKYYASLYVPTLREE
jgi:tetrapyrrole methylase family protein / MazG family protein